MKLSVALCTFEGEQFLPEFLDSISSQSRPPDEVVVCDDASSDGTWKILSDFEHRVPFDVVLLRNDHRLGAVQNFARAIGETTGDMVVLADQDDVWKAHKLTRLLEAMESDPDVGLAFSDATLVDESLRPLGYSLWEAHGLWNEDALAACVDGTVFEELLELTRVTGATMAFRSWLTPLVLPIPDLIAPSNAGTPAFYHDAWIALLASCVSRLAPVPEPLQLYRQHSGQQTGVVAPATWADDTTGIEWPGLPRLELSIPIGELTRRRAVIAQYVDRRLGTRIAEEHWSRSVAQRSVTYMRDYGRHFGMRTSLPEDRLARILPVLREVLTDRYSRFSGGRRSAVRDILGPPRLSPK